MVEFVTVVVPSVTSSAFSSLPVDSIVSPEISVSVETVVTAS